MISIGHKDSGIEDFQFKSIIKAEPFFDHRIINRDTDNVGGQG